MFRRRWRRKAVGRRAFLKRLCFGVFAVPFVLLGCTDMGGVMHTAALNAREVSQFEISGNHLILNGDLNRHTPQQFQEITKAHPGLDTLVLVNVPGSVDDGATLAFGRMVRAARMRTHLIYRSEIASGAVDLFLAGTRRTMERGARIGVHSWADGYGEGRDVGAQSAEHDPYIFYTEDMLGTADFYWFTLGAAPSTEVHWMSEAEILRFGLVTSAVMEARR